MQNILLGYNYSISKLSALICAFTLAALAGCSGAPSTATTTATATATAATLQLSATATSVPSDNSASTTITVTALSGANAALSGIVVTLATDTGVLSVPTVTTGADGTATFTFRSGTASLANRTATISASAGATAQIQVQIAGSSLSVFGTSGSSVANDGSSTVAVTFIAKNAQGTGIQGVPYTASWVTTTGGQLSITPTSGTTDAQGKFTVTVAGTGAPATGTATLMATAGGSTASATITVSAVAGTFGISQTSNSTGPVVTVNPTTVPMKIGDLLTVTVSAPTSANVTFATTQGTWSGAPAPGTTTTVAVAGGVASAVLNQTVSGTANVQVYDTATPALTDSLTVGVTAVTPYSITLTASPTVVPKSSGTTTGTSTLIATVRDASNQPVGNAPVAFSMTNTTGGGESIAPVIAYTTSVTGGGLSLGQASATFTSGSLSSTSTGVQVHAAVLGTTVATGTAPSSSDASIIIGGTAGSIAFGIATKIIELNTTTYQQPMSVLVADSAGNPVANATVTLSVWPSAWSTGNNCIPDFGGGLGLGGASGAGETTTTGTFINEDINGNLVMDTGEDGYRKHLISGVVETGGMTDGQLTPVNSMAGSVPSQVTTDASGLANFNLTYLKVASLFTIDTLRATTVVQGSSTVSQTTFRLLGSDTDVKAVPCMLGNGGNSPYVF